ncbi:glutathione ABC transporter substrate-binding protein [Brevibacillus marinus]|uniref:glutathione ABC transporter substrate-binding protein n=1 Tax=Brevibacillus marinus TaxID=2496837 RepID=UPI000F8241CA|nr:glutathione ABC transporter substrate-binding protein [Brevibacillus marinus]
MKLRACFVFLLISILLVVSACGGSSGANETSSTSNAPEQSAVEPKDLVVAFGAEPLTLDPHDADDAVSNQANNILYDKLVTFDRNNQIVPELATEWKISDDGLKMTFKLREGVTFQDGTPFNAEAVKINFERIINPDHKLSRHSLYAEFIDKIVVDSEYQVTFQFKKPFGPAISAFAHGAGGIISPKAIQENQEIAKNPAGTGPYKLKSWTPGTEIVFEPNENYWGEKPQFKSITFKPVPENSSRTIMLENGEADIIVPLPTQDVERIKQSDEFVVDIAPIYRTFHLWINNKKPLFQDVRVRQALNYAVDKETIVEKILLGQGRVADAAIGSTVYGYSPVGSYPYDPEKAKQLLAEAGVKPGTKIKLWTPDGRYMMDSKITEFIQANLTDVGFDVEFQKWEWGAYSAMMDDPNKDFDLMVFSWGTSTGDADWGLRPVYTTDGSNNYGKYSNPEVDELIAKGLASSDLVERTKIYNQAMSIIKEDAPMVFLVENTQTVGISKKVEGTYTLGNGYVILRSAVKK